MTAPEVHSQAVVTVLEDRYARQRLVPGWDQDRLGHATGVVIGVGALGNEVAKNLALSGIGRLVLCDPDLVSTSNLSRSVLFATANESPVDIPKVEAAAATLRRIAPDLRVEPRQADLTSGVGLGELADADIVVGCLDSRRARLELLGRCALVEAALVDGGTGPWGGEIRVRLDTAEPCYGCLLTAADRAESDVPWSCLDAADGQPAPATIGVSALVGAWLSLTAVRIVLGHRPAYRFLSIDMPTGRTEQIVATRDATCLHHRPFGAWRTVGASAASTVADLLRELPPEAEPAGWALFPIAAGGDVARQRRSQQLRDAHDDTPLHTLGVAAEEILPVRTREGSYQWVRLSR